MRTVTNDECECERVLPREANETERVPAEFRPAKYDRRGDVIASAASRVYRGVHALEPCAHKLRCVVTRNDWYGKYNRVEQTRVPSRLYIPFAQIDCD